VLSLLETRGGSLSVTLQVGGQLVSGDLISGLNYFETMAEKMKTAQGNAESHITDALASIMESLKDAYKPEANGPDQLPPTYIHLRNARFVGLPGTSATGIYWRGRLSAVDGFVIASLG
jgi:hypothetical protein